MSYFFKQKMSNDVLTVFCDGKIQIFWGKKDEKKPHFQFTLE